MNNHDLAAGNDLAAILAIPLFLQRPPREKVMENTQATHVALVDEPPDQNCRIQDEPPTFEELIAVIRKLTTKRDGITETIRILKKQAEGMLRKL